MLYTYLHCFFIYSFLGWCCEVAFHTLTCGNFSNRGFLYGPACPNYGFGAVAVLLVCEPFADNTWLLFLISTVITTLIELVTGFVLDKVFHNKWWDYSNYPFNIGGYICPLFSLLWGIACVIIIKIVHPALMLPISVLPKTLGIVLLIIFSVLFIIDTVFTVLGILKFNRHLRALERTTHELREISEKLGLKINDNVLVLMDKTRSAELDLEIKKAEYTEKVDALRDKYLDELDKFRTSDYHLLKAFPRMKSRIYDLNALRERLKDKLKR
ncbi:MAG: hypothetical protein LUG52_00545 [Clostridia bacterium]|nr:hypothetical protein [Clostridia bacterium]